MHSYSGTASGYGKPPCFLSKCLKQKLVILPSGKQKKAKKSNMKSSLCESILRLFSVKQLNSLGNFSHSLKFNECERDSQNWAQIHLVYLQSYSNLS